MKNVNLTIKELQTIELCINTQNRNATGLGLLISTSARILMQKIQDAIEACEDEQDNCNLRYVEHCKANGKAPDTKTVCSVDLTLSIDCKPIAPHAWDNKDFSETE